MNARLQARVLKFQHRPARRWPCDLGRPTDPLHNTLAARVQSILHGIDWRDAAPLSASDFTTNQALDVIAWRERSEGLPRATNRLLAFFKRTSK